APRGSKAPRELATLSYGCPTRDTHSQRNDVPATDPRDGRMRVGARAGTTSRRELGLGTGVLRARQGAGGGRPANGLPSNHLRTREVQRRFESQDLDVRRDSIDGTGRAAA